MGSVFQPKLKSGKLQATYRIKYYINGKAQVESTGLTNEAEAKRLLKEREGRVATGQPVLPRMDKIRYEEARADLVAFYETYGTRDVSEAKARLAHLDPYFAGRKLVTIGPADATSYAAARQHEEAANGTINRELATLSKLLHLAYKNGKLLRLPVIEKLREADPRAGFVTREEFDAVSRNLPLELQTAALVAFTLGWRKREVLDLEPRQLDLSTGTLRLDPGMTKNREGRVAYLTSELRDALVAQIERVRELGRACEPPRVIRWLFPHLDGQHAGKRIVDPRKVWSNACRRAGRPGLLLHDLRRSAVRNMEQDGVPRSVATKISGHKTEAVYRRYAIVSDADLASAARKMAARNTVSEVSGKTATAAGQVRFQVRP